MSATIKPTTLRVFHLDDDELVVAGLGEELRRLGDPCRFEVNGFTRAHDFERKLTRERPDVALIDINLTEKDGRSGVDVIAALHSLYPDLPIVALSSNLQSIKAAVQAGAIDFIAKRAPISELALRLHTLVVAPQSRTRRPSQSVIIPGVSGPALAERIHNVLHSPFSFLCGELRRATFCSRRAANSHPLWLGRSRHF